METGIIEQHTPATISTSSSIFNTQTFSQLMEFANFMASSHVAIPDHLKEKPADCMAVAMQALQWGMNPYAVAQKTHLVGGKLGYEAQLVNAVISSSSAIKGRFKYEYEGDWSRCTSTKEIKVEKNGKNGKYTTTERARAWSDEDEIGLSIRVGAVLQGEDEITWGEPVYLSSVVIRNSPLWVSNPKQQIAYLALKYWSRLYTPDVILGVYTKDELEEREEKVINPVQDPVSMRKITAANTDSPVVMSTQDSSNNIGALADELRHKIEQAGTLEKATTVGNLINESKSLLGTSLYTELKNKATQRYHRINACLRVDAAINELPRSDEPDAVQRFEKVEKTLSAAKRHLGDELYDQYRITLDDMKPEYVG